MTARARTTLGLLTFSLGLSAIACATTGAGRGASSPDRAAPLRAADAGMSQALAASDLEGFARHVDQDALWGGARGFLTGRDEVVESWRRFAEPAGPRLRWSPTNAGISREGDLGYTIGTYRFEGKDRDGAPLTADGRYLTVWRRGHDGFYGALFDLELTAEPAPVERRAPTRIVESAGGDLRAVMGMWHGPAAQRGGFLTIEERGADGVYGLVAETFVPFAK